MILSFMKRFILIFLGMVCVLTCTAQLPVGFRAKYEYAGLYSAEGKLLSTTKALDSVSLAYSKTKSGEGALNVTFNIGEGLKEERFYLYSGMKNNVYVYVSYDGSRILISSGKRIVCVFLEALEGKYWKFTNYDF